MPLTPFSVRGLPDQELLDALRALASRDADLEADLLVHLAELDARELHLGLGYRSLFAYCTEVLHFSESVAYYRIAAARAARDFPRVLEAVRSGELHLSGLRLLVPHLTPENTDELIDRARRKSKRAIEETGPGASSPPLAPRPVRSKPLGASRYEIAFTASAETCAKLDEARALLRHQIPDGNLARIFDRALDALLREARRSKFAETERPRATARAASTGSATRHVPAAIKRAVAQRDRGRCTFVARDGRRCGSLEALEFHHVQPFAHTRRHRVDEITLRCREHNRYAAILDYGADHMARFRSHHSRSGARLDESSPPRL